MKIAILVLLFPPRWLAGTEIATYNIARHLANRGHEVHVITSLDEGLLRESSEQGFYVHRISFPRLRLLGTAVFWLKELLLLVRLKPDLIHGQDIGTGVPGVLAKRLLGTPYVVWARGLDVYSPRLYGRTISALALKNADAVIALTEDMKRKMQEMRSRDISVVPNGIDLKRFDDLPREEMRVKLQAKQDDGLIIFVGRFRPEKGVRHLIEAFDTVRQNHRSVRLVLVGEGPEEVALKDLVRQLNLGDYIEFAGQVPNECVPQYMAAADIFVLPSLLEGFPNVVLEAMAAGLPIVASRVGGLSEIIEEGDNGFLVEPGMPEQIADTVLLLLRNDELRARISEGNRTKVKSYSWERVVDKLEEIYRSLLLTSGPALS